MPDKEGKIDNIALSLNHYNDYMVSDTYAGATVGPVAGRIREGILPIMGEKYQLPKNESGNTLHSGPINLGHTLWKLKEICCGEDEARITFYQHLPDGENGFPGDRDFWVSYSLTDKNTLKIQYTVTSNKTTWINMTNHTYWNLTGDFTKPCDNQVLQINADTVFFNNSEHLPVSCEAVKGTPFDFTSPRSVASALESDPSNKQLANAFGYNNAYVLKKGCDNAAVLYDPMSGRRITITTDYPSLVFYSGGYLFNAGHTIDNQKIAAGSAYAFEAQYLPDAPYLMGKNMPFLQPGQSYHKEIAFHFDWI